MVTAYRSRVHAAFANALAPVEADADSRSARAEMLTALYVGILITARIDTQAAAVAAEQVAAQFPAG